LGFTLSLKATRELKGDSEAYTQKHGEGFIRAAAYGQRAAARALNAMSAMENATDYTVTIAEKAGPSSRTVQSGNRIELGSSATSLTLGHELGHAWSHHSNDLEEINYSGQVATNWENAMRIGYGGVNRGVV
jgi:hypothetical protein